MSFGIRPCCISLAEAALTFRAGSACVLVRLLVLSRNALHRRVALCAAFMLEDRELPAESSSHFTPSCDAMRMASMPAGHAHVQTARLQPQTCVPHVICQTSANPTANAPGFLDDKEPAVSRVSKCVGALLTMANHADCAAQQLQKPHPTHFFTHRPPPPRRAPSPRTSLT